MFIEVNPKTDEEWLEMRTNVLTATDMGVILGLNKWKSVAQLIENKENFVPFENSYTWLGQTLEQVVVDATNKVLDTNFELFDNGTRSFFLNDDLRLGATPDAVEDGTLLECKSTKPGNYLKWAGWPPAYYLSQLYTQMLCTGRSTGLLAIMSTNLTQQSEELNIPIHIHRLTRDPELDKIFLDAAEAFWIARDKGKVYRVNRKLAPAVELKLRFNMQTIYSN